MILGQKFFVPENKSCLSNKNFSWNFMKWVLKGGISIDADSGPPRYVLWCCGGICHQVLTFIQVGYGHTVKSDFQSQFSMSKIIWIFPNFFFIEEYQFRRRFFVIVIFLKTSIFEPLCFLKWCPIFNGPCEHLWKSNQKTIFILLTFLLKSTPCWLTSAKPHHWGHTTC